MTQPRPATLMPAKAMCPASQRFRTTAKSTGTGPGLLCAKIAFIGATTRPRPPVRRRMGSSPPGHPTCQSARPRRAGPANRNSHSTAAARHPGLAGADREPTDQEQRQAGHEAGEHSHRHGQRPINHDEGRAAVGREYGATSAARAGHHRRLGWHLGPLDGTPPQIFSIEAGVVDLGVVVLHFLLGQAEDLQVAVSCTLLDSAFPGRLSPSAGAVEGVDAGRCGRDPATMTLVTASTFTSEVSQRQRTDPQVGDDTVAPVTERTFSAIS